MIPNNNLSVLPWYTSIAQQNARKWWIYNRIYPLFTPAGFLLPFQIIRNSTKSYSPDGQLQDIDNDTGVLLDNGVWDDSIGGSAVTAYKIPNGCESIYVENLPKPRSVAYVSMVARDVDDNPIGVYRPEFDSSNHFTGGWDLPEGTSYILVNTYVEEYEVPGQECEVFAGIGVMAPVQSFLMYVS